MHLESLEPRALMAADPIALSRIGGFDHGGFATGAAEITAYEPTTQRLFVVNAQTDELDILDYADPANPALLGKIDTAPLGSPNSVATRPGLVAVAIENQNKQLPGVVAFYSPDGTLLKTVTVGALPDMITFSPDGDHVLTANEGEPNSYNQPDSLDPEGSVSIVRVPKKNAHVADKLKQSDVRTASFAAFNARRDELLAKGVRLFGPNATVAQDLEPEYIAVSPDGKRAYVTLQENNAIAVIDLWPGKVLEILPLGYKDWSRSALDPSDRDNAIAINPWPVFGMYQPDSIATIQAGGQTFLVTANEGDARDYAGFAEEARVSALPLDPTAFPNATDLKKNPALGRLNVTRALGDTDNDGDHDRLYTFGARSFSVWTTDGQLVFDSGAQLEQLTAAAFPAFFNAGNEDNAFDSRSDNKGPEPEGLTIGVVEGRTYAFVGLERIGGVAVYDITNPAAPQFVQYVNYRDFTKPVNTPAARDLGPEGLTFIPAAQSPTGKPLLVLANEISGTTSTFEIGAPAAAPPTTTRAAHPPEANAPATSTRPADDLFSDEPQD